MAASMIDERQKAGRTGKQRRCPICGKPVQEATLPFCSRRCRDVDLNRWLSGTYVVPASEDDGDGE
jgi:endogenous inhibitor of DNA gyrase (YacG/DUF329 family)